MSTLHEQPELQCPRSPGGRFDSLVIALLAVPLYVWIAIRDDIIGSISDSAIYLVMADLFSPWRSQPHALGLSLFRDFPFPPLYPALMGILGGGSTVVAHSFAITAVLSAAMLFATHKWLRSVGIKRWDACGITLLFACLPVVLLNAMNLQSESLYVAMSLGALALVERGRGEAGAVVAGLSVLARSAGIALLFGMAIWLWRRYRGGQRYRSLAVLLLPLMAWWSYRALIGAETGYSQALWRSDLAGFVEATIGTVQVNLRVLPAALAHCLDQWGGRQASVIGALIMIAAGLGWLQRLRRGDADAVYVGAYFGLILVWPFPSHLARFLLVVLPILIAYAYFSLAAGLLRLGAGRFVVAAQRTLLGVLFMAVAPSTMSIVGQVSAAGGSEIAALVRSPQWYRYADPRDAMRSMERVDDIMESIRGIDERLPPDACVSSTAAPYVSLYGHRRARWIMPAWAPDDVFIARLSSCPYVFMMAATQALLSGYPTLYPYHRLAGRLEVIEVKLFDTAAERGEVLTMLARATVEEQNQDSPYGGESAITP